MTRFDYETDYKNWRNEAQKGFKYLYINGYYFEVSEWISKAGIRRFLKKNGFNFDEKGTFVLHNRINSNYDGQVFCPHLGRGQYWHHHSDRTLELDETPQNQTPRISHGGPRPNPTRR